jgi:hypothetical protein
MKQKCSGAEPVPTIEALSNKVMHLEEIWKAGDVTNYYGQALAVSWDYDKILMRTRSNTNLYPIAVAMLAQLADKPAITNLSVLQMDLLVMDNMASHLLPNPNVSIAQRQLNTQVLSELLGRLRAEHIPDYTFRPFVEPTDGVENAETGMNPNPAAITNPVLRAQYEATIWTNCLNNCVNRRQDKLAEMTRWLTPRIIDYMTSFFMTGQATTEFIQECMQQARLAEKEKAEMWQKINAAKSPLPKTRFLKTIGFLFLFVFISIGMKLNCSGAEPVPTIEALSNKVAHLEEIWKAGDITNCNGTHRLLCSHRLCL